MCPRLRTNSMDAVQLKEVNQLVFRLDNVVSEVEVCVVDLHNILEPNGLIKQTKKRADRLRSEINGLKLEVKKHKEKTDGS